MIWLLIAIVGVLGGIMEATKDTITFRFESSKFALLNPKFWNPNVSWQNKYVSGSKIKKWLFKTILVWVTDAWHLVKVVETLSVFIGFTLCHIYAESNWYFIIYALFLYLVKKSTFETFLHYFNINS